MRRVAIDTLVWAMLERLQHGQVGIRRQAIGDKPLTRPPVKERGARVAEATNRSVSAQATGLKGASRRQGPGSSDVSNAMKTPGGFHQARGSIAMCMK